MTFTALQKKLLNSFVFLIVLIYVYLESQNRGDFLIFLSASKDLFVGSNIYTNLYFDYYHYFYSVFFAIVLYPFTLINAHMAMFIWLLFNVLLVYRLYKLVNNFLETNNLTIKQFKILWLVTGLFSARLLLENLHTGQITIFLLYLCLEGISQIRNEKKITGAFLIALGINIKLLPIVILPYLIYRKELKASLFILLFYVVLLYIPVFQIGFEQNNILLKTWWNLINPSNTNHIIDVEERSFHGISTLLSVLLLENVPDTFALKIKRNIIDLNVEQLKYTLLITRLILISITLYFIRTLPFKKAANSTHQFWEISYILLLIPLIFPHQQHYAFLFIVPAFMYCVLYVMLFNQSISPLKKNSIIVALSLIYLLVNLKLLLGEYNHYYEHFKILTYGTLLLIIVLAILTPKSNFKTK